MASGITTDDALQKLQEQLICTICLGQMDNPKTLTCQHSYCLKCIKELAKLQDRVSCPSCRKETKLPNGVQGLPPSFLINSIKEAIEQMNQKPVVMCESCDEAESTMYCQMCCSYCCEQCLAKHNELTINEQHTVIESEKVGSSITKEAVKCKKHRNNAATVHCETCEEIICSQCVLGTHKTHDYQSLADMNTFVKHRHKLQAMTPCLKDTEKKLIGNIRILQQRKRDINRASERAKRDIKFAVEQKCHQVIKALMNDVDEAVGIKKKTLNEKEKELDELRKNVLQYVHNIEDSVQTATPLEVLALQGKVEQKATEINHGIQSTPLEHGDIKFMSSAKTGGNIKEIQQQIGFVRYNLQQAKTVEFIDKSNCSAVQNEVCIRTIYITLPDDTPIPVPPSNISCKLFNSQRVEGDGKKCTVKETLIKGQYTVQFIPNDPGIHRLNIQVSSDPDDCCYTLEVPVSHLAEMRGTLIKIIPGVNTPSGIAVTDDGLIVVGEWGNNDVKILNPENGEAICTFGSQGESEGQFKYVCGIALSKRGTILVVDRGNHRIQEFSVEGRFINSTGNDELTSPVGIAVNKTTGQVYVAQDTTYIIAVFHDDLTSSHSFPVLGAHHDLFGGPIDLAIDSQGMIFVAEYFISRILKFNSEGQFILAFHTRQNDVSYVLSGGITIDGYDNVYISDYDKNISVYKSNGDFLYGFKCTNPYDTDDLVGPDSKESVFGIALNEKTQLLYVCDEAMNCIYVYCK